MKAEAQRIAIAEVCGWRGSNKNNFLPPDYLNDLNAAIRFAEHVRGLGFSFNLSAAPDEKGFIADFENEKESFCVGNISPSVAICKAGLQALGKWVEE